MNPAIWISGIVVLLTAAVAVAIIAVNAKRRNRYRSRFDVGELARRLDISEDELRAVSPTYRVAEIPKRRGGTRTLEIPDEPTKHIQQRILRKLLNRLDAHPLACGFEPGTSIVDAALPHVCRTVVVKMDIRQFFESTTASRIQSYFQDIGWQSEAAELLTKLTTYEGHLPQGAPTSPRISNLVNAPLDATLLKIAKSRSGSFTRYADDITISFDSRNGKRARFVVQQVRKALGNFGYQLNNKKLRILRQHQQQKVLGLVVNAQVGLPRKTRRWLRSVEHRLSNRQKATLTPEQLAGWKSLVTMIERQRSE